MGRRLDSVTSRGYVGSGCGRQRQFYAQTRLDLLGRSVELLKELVNELKPLVIATSIS